MIRTAPIALLLAPLVLGAGPAPAEVSFNQQIRPILSDRCFHCHGPDAENQKSDLRLDSLENATADLGGYEAIVPGDLKGSELHHRIHSTDPDDQMPPPKSNRVLSAGEIALLDRWIEEGAKYDVHWAFKPIPKSTPVPDVPAGQAAFARNEIDRFIAARTAAAGLPHAPEVAPEKWLRRATFDLTGLPPTLPELDAFVAAPDKTAAIDRLLDTDAHAERMTTEWLDVARYSDTYGYQVDRDRYVWPWRDWVIRAFRSNMPYDTFITEQIAGDLLPGATREQILATTFCRLHPQKVEGGSVPEEFRVEYVADRTHTAGTAFLGLTMECSRCHDHKYDPISQEEYYQLGAFFSQIDEAGLYSFFTRSIPTPALDLPQGNQEEELGKKEAAVGRAEFQLAEARKAARAGEGFKSWAAPAPLEPAGQLLHMDFEDFKSGANKQVEGKVGMGVQLTGDHAITTKVGNFSRDQPFSVAAWINTPDHKERAVVWSRSKAWQDAGSRGYELLIEEGNLSFALVHFWPGNALRVRLRDPLPPGAWHHVTVTYDGSSRAAGVGFFVDGKPIAPEGLETVRDKLTREIQGGGNDSIHIGERMRDKGFKNGLIDEFRVFGRRLGRGEVAAIAGLAPARPPAPDDLLDLYLATAGTPDAAAHREALAALQKTREARSAAQKAIAQIMVMREMERPRKNYILERGVYDARGEEVAAGTPAALPPFPAGQPANRLGLARWLTADNHPLTARVTVNRYWQMIFGTGLVATPEDFGSQGKPPTHPQLLDWLARDFIDSGWDVRHLLRQMLLSATYAQSTLTDPATREKDPENRLLARFPPRRLTAEMVRDNALAASGLLVRKVGGPHVKPYEVQFSFKPAKPSGGEGLYRRSLYTWWQRTAPAPVMMTLNASKRDVCRVRREVTASPLQALVLMNDPQIIEACRALAARLAAEKPRALIETAFRTLTSRPPDEGESETLLALFEEQRQAFETDPKAARQLLATGASEAQDDPSPATTAAATITINAIMNLDEAMVLR